MNPFEVPNDRPALMGILNVTPDSFSDGNQYTSMAKALEHARRIMSEGADLIDVGGESTRPGAEPVSVEEEIARVLPIVEQLLSEGFPISVDTYKSLTAQMALERGACMINDVTGGRDPKLVEACARAGAHLCLMHMKGEPKTMQRDPRYENVVDEVLADLLAAVNRAIDIGCKKEAVWIDPGIGFGKTSRHNLALLANLPKFVDLGQPVLIGVSRKGFLGKLTGSTDPLDRLEATLAAQVLAQAAGVRMIRAHDVKAARRAIDVAAAILRA